MLLLKNVIEIFYLYQLPPIYLVIEKQRIVVSKVLRIVFQTQEDPQQRQAMCVSVLRQVVHDQLEPEDSPATAHRRHAVPVWAVWQGLQAERPSQAAQQDTSPHIHRLRPITQRTPTRT